LLLDQVYVTFVAFDGAIVAESCVVCPALVSVAVEGLSEMLVAVTLSDVTVTVHVAVSPSAATVIVAVPLATAVTTPLLTVATEVLLEDQMASDAAVDTLLTTDNVAAWPTVMESDDCDIASVGVVVDASSVVLVAVVPSETMGESILHAMAIQQAVTTKIRIRNILFFMFLYF
jgi:hypothetical protein